MKSLLLEEKVGFAKQNSDEVVEINFYNNSLIITPHQSCGRQFVFVYIILCKRYVRDAVPYECR